MCLVQLLDRYDADGRLCGHRGSGRSSLEPSLLYRDRYAVARLWLVLLHLADRYELIVDLERHTIGAVGVVVVVVDFNLRRSDTRRLALR